MGESYKFILASGKCLSLEGFPGPNEWDRELNLENVSQCR